jgi:uncharacterized protein (DUF305 family)
MTIGTIAATGIARRRALRIVGALAGAGLGGTLFTSGALAQQAGGMPGMPGMPGGGAPGGMMDGGSSMMGMLGMMGGLTGPESDRTFIQEMIPHHQSAVVMAMAAWGKAEHPEINRLAEAIIASQNHEIEQMAAWYRDWFGGPVPASSMGAMMSGMMPGMMPGMGMAAPAPAEPTSVDRTFIEKMIPHHRMAVMMASMALGAHQRPELGRLEQAIVADQAREIGQMRTWQRTWFRA